MIKPVLCFLMLVCCSFTTTIEPLTDAERNFAVAHLTETQAYLLNAVKGLSEAQLNFKASPQRWSILECVEHIANTEILVPQIIAGELKKTANPEKRAEIKFTDEKLIAVVIDRTNKVKAPEELLPTGKYVTLQASLDAFRMQREKTIDYLKSTPDDLRGHVSMHPILGMLDTYQWILVAAAHQKRHTLQIEEVKADKNFPIK